MLLTIDVGNTNTLFGLYRGAELIDHWRIKTDQERMPDEYGFLLLGFFNHGRHDPGGVKGIAMGSVVPPLTKIFTRMCERYFNHYPLLVGDKIKTGIRILIDDPSTVGADRIADVVATHVLYGGPACIVDLGTATTFDAMSKEGDYLGGAIVPGLAISADALFTRTAKLPKVELEPPPQVIGSNTITAIQSGLMFGYASLIEGMIARFRRELGAEMRVVATGGLARAFSELCIEIDYINPWLTLEGLRILWEMNQEG